jgi:hypothetical protein
MQPQRSDPASSIRVPRRRPKADCCYSLLIVLWLTLYVRAISISVSPASRRATASRFWCGVRSAKLNPSRYCPRTSFSGSCPDKFTFKFSEAAEHGQHQSTVRCRRVGPRIAEGTKACFTVAN